MATAAEQVWGAAVAAHRINDGYLKDSTWDYDKTPATIIKEANKLMVKRWVDTGDFRQVTADDVEQGQVLRNHFRGYLFMQIAGKLNDFQQTALKIAQLEEFTPKHRLELAILSSLPSVYSRDNARKVLDTAIRESSQIDLPVGTKVQGELKVVDCRYSMQYNKNIVKAQVGNSFVDFWFSDTLTVGSRYEFRGKVKKVRGDNTTQLNYVKILS